MIDPGMAYFRAQTDSEAEAMMLKAIYESLRRSQD